MHRFLTALGFAIFFSLLPVPAQAWNAAGHRLVAHIAWQQLSPASRHFVATALSRHGDYERWVDKAKSTEAAAIFAEASTWPDDIRRDPRFYDAGREPPTPAIDGFSDTARHKNWHYIDLDANNRVVAGEIDQQIDILSRQLDAKAHSPKLRSTAKNGQITYALPWLLHLVGDIHQPLHVGRQGDEGGNQVEIENPFNKRLPFTSLHTYWDDLPGPPWLRGPRLAKNAARLLENYPPPHPGDVRLWRDESHRLLATAYPTSAGSLLPIISENFHQQARETANRRIVEAGYRLGWLLENLITPAISRETP